MRAIPDARCAVTPYSAPLHFPIIAAMNDTLQISKSRIDALTDGVYAVVLTLLVLDLKLGAVPEPAATGLVAELAALVPKALVWVLSFWVAALFWQAQNRALRDCEHLDKAAVLIELAQLAVVTLLPFSTSLIGEHGNVGLVALIYSLHLSLLALLSLVRLRHVAALPHGAGFDPEVIRQQVRGVATVLACTLLAALLAWWWPGWNMFAMLGILLRRPVMRWRGA